jgi:hypothetical protein
MLLARIYHLLPLLCPLCGEELRIIAFITEHEPIRKILNHIGEPTTPPEISPPRGPPEIEYFEPSKSEDEFYPTADYEIDQTMNW